MWLVQFIKTIIATVLPQILKDAFAKKEPSSPVPAEGATPPAPEPGSPAGEEGSTDSPEPAEIDKDGVLEVNIVSNPDKGQYLIEEDATNVSGIGFVKGPGWVRRMWPPAGGGAYYYVTRVSDDKTGFVQWRPFVREEGEYDVFVRYAASPNRTTEAVYIVRCLGGPATVRVNQRKSSEGTEMRWAKLGRWKFGAGKEGFIRLLNTGGHSESADSLAMRKV